jgi:hypothetical protein
MAAERLIASSLRSSSRVAIFALLELGVSTNGPDPPEEKLLRLLRDNQIDLSVVEGLRLVVAFNKIKDSSDRRMVIELAERLGQ